MSLMTSLELSTIVTGSCIEWWRLASFLSLILFHWHYEFVLWYLLQNLDISCIWGLNSVGDGAWVTMLGILFALIFMASTCVGSRVRGVEFACVHNWSIKNQFLSKVTFCSSSLCNPDPIKVVTPILPFAYLCLSLVPSNAHWKVLYGICCKCCILQGQVYCPCPCFQVSPISSGLFQRVVCLYLWELIQLHWGF